MAALTERIAMFMIHCGTVEKDYSRIYGHKTTVNGSKLAPQNSTKLKFKKKKEHYQL